MADHSGEPPSTPTPPPTDAASRQGPAGMPAPLPPAPRVNPPTIYKQKEPHDAPQADPADYEDFVEWKKAAGRREPSALVETKPETEEPRTRISKKQKKFHRYDPEADKATETARGSESDENETDEAAAKDKGYARAETELPTAVSRELAEDLRSLTRKKRPKPKPVVERSSGFIFGMQFAVFALAVGAFFLGRATVRKSPAPLRPNAPAAPALSADGKLDAAALARSRALIDEAMWAEKNNDFQKAIELLQASQEQGVRAYGLDYHLGLLAYEAGDLPRVLPLLNQSIAAGEQVAASYNLRGAMANRQGGLGRGLADLETATQLDPFEGRYFFFLGEALRRTGKTQTAVENLRCALARARDPGMEQMYRLKMHLALVELGKENEFAESLAKALSAKPPALDWLLAAAAVDMHHGRFAEAAAYLEKARVMADKDSLSLLLRDYYFMGFANQKELARFYLAPPIAGEKATPSVSGRDEPSAAPTPPPVLETPR